MDWQKAADSIIAGVLGIILVGGAVYQSLTTGQIEVGLLAMATAVVSVYFTGRANRQVNGEKVDALTKAVGAINKRLDEKNFPPAADGNTPEG